VKGKKTGRNPYWSVPLAGFFTGILPKSAFDQPIIYDESG